MSTCNCYIARHPLASKIDAALLTTEDPRAIAERFRVGKSKVYEHRGHLKAAGAAFVAVARPETSEAPAPRPEPEEPVKAEPAPAESHREPTAESPPVAAPPKRQEPPREPAPAVVPRVDAVHGIVESSVPQGGNGERKEESGEDGEDGKGEQGEAAGRKGGGVQKLQIESSKSFARAQPQVVEIEEKTAPPAFHGTGYEAAVRRCAGLIVDGKAKPAELHKVQERFGLSRPRIRQAYYEAARHLRYDMGGLLERQEASIGWVVKHRDEASEKAIAREMQAAKWREAERRAHEDAQGIEDAEARVAALDSAARMGATASKYGLEAEKWAALALSHQKHLDDIQCLLGPKELSLTQNNISLDGVAMVERLGKMLSAKFAGRADLVREIEEAVSALLLGDGDATAITVAGESV